MIWWLFHVFVACHIATGAVGLVIFWVPVIGRKGGRTHRGLGRLFVRCLIATGISATGMSLCTLYDPVATHPQLALDPELMRGLFGWMMLYLSVLTISLAWHGLVTIHRKTTHDAHRGWFSIGLQCAAILVALNCALQGCLIGQPLMMGIAVVGVASGITNLHFIYRTRPSRMAYLKEHVKALVGAGISVYTAFMTFGLARLLPSHAFNPAIWAVPMAIRLRTKRLSHSRRTSP